MLTHVLLEWVMSVNARWTHRAAEELAALELGKDSTARKELVKNLPGKRVTVGEVVMGLVSDGDWHWASAAATRYSERELEFAKASIKS